LYPDGLKPISDLAHRHGRKFLLWFEPERVSPGTPWYQEHPDWLLSIPPENKFASWEASFHDPSKVLWESRRNQINDYDKLFDLGNPEACKFLIDYISARIEEWGIDCYRHDANMAPLDFWRAADAPDRQGIAEIRWIEGLYAFWDGLLQRHPGLIIDNCASGGRRIDLEMMSRSTPFWRTDFPVGAGTRQSQTYGISFWAPLNGTGYINLAKDNDYDLRSTFGGSFQFELFSNGMDAQKKMNYTDYPYERVRTVLNLYKSLQKYYYGDFYPLTEYSTNDDAWMAWQFHRPELNEGVVQVFRRPQSICETGRVRLHGLETAAQYSITDVDGGPENRLTGRQLMGEGLPVSLMQCPQAMILTYKKQ
jgi:alpha-galactosidase